MVLKLIKCGCSSAKPCLTGQCSYPVQPFATVNVKPYAEILLQTATDIDGEE